MVDTIALQKLTALPADYDSAFGLITQSWTSDRRALGRDVLLWLFNNPGHVTGPVRPGREFEYRLTGHAEYDVMLADVMAVRPANIALLDQMVDVVDEVKQFHQANHSLLSLRDRQRLASLASRPAVR